MATKLGRMIASLDGLLPIMSHDPLITWPCEIRGSLTGGGSARKRLSCHRLLVSVLFYFCFLHICFKNIVFQIRDNPRKRLWPGPNFGQLMSIGAVSLNFNQKYFL